MTKWIASLTWPAVGSSDFSPRLLLANMDRPEDWSLAWFKLHIRRRGKHWPRAAWPSLQIRRRPAAAGRGTRQCGKDAAAGRSGGPTGAAARCGGEWPPCRRLDTVPTLRQRLDGWEAIAADSPPLAPRRDLRYGAAPQTRMRKRCELRRPSVTRQSAVVGHFRKASMQPAVSVGLLIKSHKDSQLQGLKMLFQQQSSTNLPQGLMKKFAPNFDTH